MDIRIPNLGEGAESGSVVSILVKEGDRVAKDQTLIELENEKAVAPIPSPQAGVVTKFYVKVGDKVSVGQAILSLSETGAMEPGKTRPESPKEPAGRAEAPPAKEPSGPDEDYTYASQSGFPPPASPALRKMARELGVDLAKIKGSEPGGRITAQDVQAYFHGLQQRSSPISPRPPAEKIDFSKWGPIERKPLSSIRQKIGQKMAESWASVPHVTQFDEADITSLMELRKKHAAAYEKKGAHLTLTALVIKAVVPALKKYPLFNSSLDEESQQVVLKNYYHLGVAVDTESGLIVPVIRDADKKGLFEISKELEALAERTRSRKISVEELKGGTFTISNLGSIGGAHFTPIVNKPEVAILGLGRGTLKPVVLKEKAGQKVEGRLLLPLALSYDHRVVDGADGARFVRELVQTLESFKEGDLKL